MKALPNFVIAGAARSGTSNLASLLRSHPEVYLAPKPPEPHFFLKSWEYEKGLDYYSDRYFSAVQAQQAIGEASTSYLCHELVAQRMSRDLPGVRIVVMLRNPITRAFSSYWHTKKHGLEAASFWEALTQEDRRAASETDPVRRDVLRPFAYVERGRYARQLKAYFRHIPRQQVYVTTFDDFVANPISDVNRVLEFLNVAKSNWTAPPAVELNQSTPAGEFMDDACFEFLRAAFYEELLELSELLQRDLTSWLRLRTDSPAESVIPHAA